MSDTEQAPVLFELQPVVHGRFLGVAALNRPARLNALNLEMCRLLLDQFRIWASDESIVGILLVGAGAKGFCAGGDVAEVARQIRAGGPGRYVYGDQFFSVEYQLDLMIHQFPKPIIAYAHGVCMGGGLGLFSGASHRIVSDQAKLGMPEIHIGLFPDVGGGYFLNRMPGNAGLLMATTGLVINEADALFGGLADFFWPIEDRAKLIQGLAQLDWTGKASSDRKQVSLWLLMASRKYSSGLPTSNLRQYFDAIRYLTMLPDAIGLRDALLAASQEDPWFKAPAESLAHGSPTSAALIVEYMRRTRKMSLAEVLELDWLVARQCQRGHDFAEGVRALLIDKDRKPKWSPERLEDVSPERGVSALRVVRSLFLPPVVSPFCVSVCVAIDAAGCTGARRVATTAAITATATSQVIASTFSDSNQIDRNSVRKSCIS